MAIFQIPLTNIPQTFDISLAGVLYTVTCRWNDAADSGWTIDFVDANSGESIANNIPLITGADMLDGLQYLGIQGQLFVYTDGDDTAIPTLDNLGVESNVYFSTQVSNG